MSAVKYVLSFVGIAISLIFLLFIFNVTIYLWQIIGIVIFSVGFMFLFFSQRFFINRPEEADSEAALEFARKIVYKRLMQYVSPEGIKTIKKYSRTTPFYAHILYRTGSYRESQPVLVVLSKEKNRDFDVVDFNELATMEEVKNPFINLERRGIIFTPTPDENPERYLKKSYKYPTMQVNVGKDKDDKEFEKFEGK